MSDADYLAAEFGITTARGEADVVPACIGRPWCGMNPSAQQLQIGEWFQTAPASANLVVRARAGTGKTKTIIESIKYIPADQAVAVCAFNKRIANELKAKLAGTPVEVLTLHALGFKFLKGAWGDGLTVDVDVEEDRIERACQEFDRTLPGWEVMMGLKKLVGIAKGAAPDIAQSGAAAISRLAELCSAFSCDPDYSDPSWMAQRALRAMALSLVPDPQGRISFDDMLFIPAALGFALPLYDWVIVDEAQDMNLAQLLLAQKACRPGGHIVVVGDDRQAIYGFRGADSDAVDRLKRELNAEEFGLTTTYRCPRSVVALAQTIVHDYDPAPWAAEGTVDECDIEELVEAVKGGDVILSRVNAPLVPLCLGLIRRGVAARIEGRDIGKLLATRAKKLKAATVGDFLAKLTTWANNATSRAIARGKAVDARLMQIRDVEATLAAMAEDAVTVQDVYDRCQSMFNDVAGSSESTAMVVLSTVHKAKGLEWRRVFVLDDTFYFFGKKRGVREEENIHYVALTRSQAHLTIVKGNSVAAF